MSDVSRLVINAVRAKSKGEALAHCFTRRTFIRHVVADSRTRDLYARWRHEGKLDLVIVEWIAQLDAAATRAGLSHRSAFRHDDEAARALVAAPVRAIVDECAQLYAIRLAGTREARAHEVLAFVSGTLYRDPPPIRAWLAVDLLSAFDAEIENSIVGAPVMEIDTIVPALATLRKGQRPMHNGTHLERDATWYYQTSVQQPPVGWATLAETYQRDRAAAGATIMTKDRDGRADRFNDSVIRRGATNAQRLLELTVPPEQWNRFNRLFRPRAAKRSR